jgi:hypothetical protein
MPCDIIFVALILALSSSARYSASSLMRYLSGLAGRALLLLMYQVSYLVCYRNAYKHWVDMLSLIPDSNMTLLLCQEQQCCCSTLWSSKWMATAYSNFTQLHQQQRQHQEELNSSVTSCDKIELRSDNLWSDSLSVNSVHFVCYFDGILIMEHRKHRHFLNKELRSFFSRQIQIETDWQTDWQTYTR